MEPSFNPKKILQGAGILGQPSYDIFRRFHSEQKAPLIVVLGSGLSVPAGLPNWEGLQAHLYRACESTVSAYNKIGDDLFNFSSRLESAKQTSDPWVKFKLYKALLGPANYTTIVREALTPKNDAEIPRGYGILLGLNPRGIVTLNLDSLASRALTASRPNDVQTPVFGKEILTRLDVIQSANPFLVYLHGHVADATSWVLDYDELQDIIKSHSHASFLQFLYSYCRVLFYGISADDVALSGRLMEWRAAGLKPPSLFWLTNRTDERLLSWAHENFIRVISYKANPSHEEVLEAVVNDCNGFVTRDVDLPPSKRGTSFSSDLSLTADQAASLQPDEIRKFLNDKISSLLEESDDGDHYKVFEAFLKQYARAVHNSYYVAEAESENVWFGNKLAFPSLGEGTFGQVFLSEGSSGQIAVKILREAIHQKTEMLGAFRRGVKSMKIITASSIPGMIKFRDAYEVPPTILMDFVNGASLEAAVRSGVAMDWLTKVKIIKTVGDIVRQAHLLPETVLHRDLKPSNIMLKDYAYDRLFEPDVVVLDFDMSWHKDSTEKDVLFEARDDFAYLAPEQVNPSKLSMSRSTLVDSYGLGMTAFYLFGGVHPKINAFLDASWPAQIYQAVRRGYEHGWISAPGRIARMIATCTSDNQAKRLDFGQIIAELTSIETAVTDFRSLQDARLFAEEVIANIVGAERYNADRQGIGFTFSSTTGVTVECVCDDRRSALTLSISWLDQGTVERKNIRRYVEEAIDRSAAILGRSSWNLNKKDPRLGGVSISADIGIEAARKDWTRVLQAAKNTYGQFNFA